MPPLRKTILSRRWLLAAGAAAALSACGPRMPVPPDAGPLDLQLTSGGLRVPSADQRIDFGRDEAGVVAAVSKLLNATPTGAQVNSECGAGPIKTVGFAKGIDLLFQDGDFRGWSASSPIFVTADNIKPTMSRTALEAAGITGFTKTTLGTEFEANGVFGLLELPGENATVGLLWAGVSCFFR